MAVRAHASSNLIHAPLVHFAAEVDDWDEMLAHLDGLGVAHGKTMGPGGAGTLEVKVLIPDDFNPGRIQVQAPEAIPEAEARWDWERWRAGVCYAVRSMPRRSSTPGCSRRRTPGAEPASTTFLALS